MIADGLPHKEKKGAQCRGVETSNGPESPAIAVIERLQETCPGRLLVVEPHVDDLPPGLAAGGRTELVSLDQALAADVILLLTDHEEFRRVDRTCLAGKRVIDTRGIWCK
jgi:UDP-N-acetyl-D-mannosaminuronic acid dehydrogenase